MPIESESPPVISNYVPLARLGHMASPHCKGLWESNLTQHIVIMTKLGFITEKRKRRY
jgi:hypothetical protein